MHMYPRFTDPIEVPDNQKTTIAKRLQVNRTPGTGLSSGPYSSFALGRPFQVAKYTKTYRVKHRHGFPDSTISGSTHPFPFGLMMASPVQQQPTTYTHKREHKLSKQGTTPASRSSSHLLLHDGDNVIDLEDHPHALGGQLERARVDEHRLDHVLRVHVADGALAHVDPCSGWREKMNVVRQEVGHKTRCEEHTHGRTAARTRRTTPRAIGRSQQPETRSRQAGRRERRSKASTKSSTNVCLTARSRVVGEASAKARRDPKSHAGRTKQKKISVHLPQPCPWRAPNGAP